MKSRLARLSERRQRLDLEWEAEVMAELDAGKSLRQVADDARVSYETVRRIKERHDGHG